MKKLLSFILCIAIIFSLTSCGYSEKKKQAALSTFESFEKSENFILLTCFELVIHGTRYDLDDIKYNGQKCNIVFLEEDGFYSYIYDQDSLSVEFLFTLYENFETTPLGTETVPSKIIDASFADNRFLFWMDDTRTDEPKKMYYSWCIDTEQPEFLDPGAYYGLSLDSYRSERYSFSRESKFFGEYLDITDNETGVTKRIDKSILKTFDEGKQIRKTKNSTLFGISQVFEDNGDIYMVSLLGVGFLGDPCYCYVCKWNFETEKCDFYTYVYFDIWQEWVTDMYIPSN